MQNNVPLTNDNVKVGDILVHKTGHSGNFWYAGREILVTSLTDTRVIYSPLTDDDDSCNYFYRFAMMDCFDRKDESVVVKPEYALIPASIYNVKVGQTLVHRTGESYEFWYEGREVTIYKIDEHCIWYKPVSDTNQTSNYFVKHRVDDFYIKVLIEESTKKETTPEIARLQEIQKLIDSLSKERDDIIDEMKRQKNLLGAVISQYS